MFGKIISDSNTGGVFSDTGVQHEFIQKKQITNLINVNIVGDKNKSIIKRDDSSALTTVDQSSNEVKKTKKSSKGIKVKSEGKVQYLAKER